MNTTEPTPFDRGVNDLERLLTGAHHPFPEFIAFLQNPTTHHDSPRLAALLVQTAPLLADLDAIPQTTYTRHHAFALRGDRAPYETPYYAKRDKLHAAALRLILGQDEYSDAVHDYIWSICEESTWVVPAHARVIDLMAAETAFGLAEIVALAGSRLDWTVRRRVRDEIERRIFAPFLSSNYDLRWFHGGDNWNGVCSGAIGGAYLYLEQDPRRLAEALSLILGSLKTFLATAFEADGSTTEGVGYWQYGLQQVIIFAELLRARTAGAIDLLAAPRLRQIAAYPGKLALPGGQFVSFSDSAPVVPLNAGLTARLALRTAEPTLLGLLAPPRPLAMHGSVGLTLRDLLWWDGERGTPAPLTDATLPASGIARLVGATPGGTAVVLAIKAGHNGENHNHNDVGSFVLYAGDEGLLIDPGPGRYDRDYFGDRRYENSFANSLGHSVPRIAGLLQGTGAEFVGALLAADTDAATGQKSVAVEFARAYPLAALAAARRTLTLGTSGPQTGTTWLHDTFTFTDEGYVVEEALLTWLPTTIGGATATIHGSRHTLRLTIEQPTGAHFALESLERESAANNAPRTLQRLTFSLPAAPTSEARVRMELSTRP